LSFTIMESAASLGAIAARLGIDVPDEHWPALVKAATFEQMRARASHLVPNRSGVFTDVEAFFRRGRSGSGRETLSPEDVAHYHARVARMAPPDLPAWLHRGEAAT
jgi:aryl sulfotransferase